MTNWEHQEERFNWKFAEDLSNWQNIENLSNWENTEDLSNWENQGNVPDAIQRQKQSARLLYRAGYVRR
ncbi:MAG: hypothetical protein HFK04_01135 [Oscillospiraceae bacterium]|nr:hypothetical protein [Oscillospiraceae bacterium]